MKGCGKQDDVKGRCGVWLSEMTITNACLDFQKVLCKKVPDSA